MFRILLVEDNLVDVRLLETLFQSGGRPVDLQRAKDGSDALDLLARSRTDPHAWMPNLILLDVNMPRVSGLEALRIIKADPNWRLIPVVVLSTSSAPAEVREAYDTHASAFVQKPSSIGRAELLVQAIEAFWLDFVVLASPASNVRPATSPKGSLLAPELAEVKGHAMGADESITNLAALNGMGCDQHYRLMEEFAAAVKELQTLHEQQFQAIIHGDPECNRFDLLIHMASEKKQHSKYAYLRHVESHGCSNVNAISNTSRT